MDGLEEVDYRIIGKTKDGATIVKVNRTENTTANSNGGNLLIHNKNDGKSYNNFEWNELNQLFGITATNFDVSKKINPAGPSGPGSYSFRLQDNSDIIKGATNADGTKNVVSFMALVSKERTVTPYNGVGGTISTVASSVATAQNSLLNFTQETINSNQSAFGQGADQVKEININIAANEYDKLATPDFKNTLQSKYKNATINFNKVEGGDSSFNLEYKGTTVKQKPTPAQ